MEQARVTLPSGAEELIRRLEGAGHQAWAVGGCVRDSLLGLAPQDWDICTSALPAEMEKAFDGLRIIPTGLRHGTLTVFPSEGDSCEVTTFRVDGPYSDHRRPDRVEFVSSLEADLRRRDFTVNAMAWNPARGLADPMGGRDDLAAGILRCVGEPGKRFREDALRILRGVRFAAWYGLVPHPDTAAAIHREKDLLLSVARERIFAEISRLLCAPGDRLEPVLREFWDVLAVLPGLECLGPMAGYDQGNPHHNLDLRDHTLRAVASVPPRLPLRLAALLHDAGKPLCRTVDEAGISHYYGHAKESARLAEEALWALRSSGTLRKKVTQLVELHDLWLPPTPAVARRWLGRLGEEQLRDLLALERGDTLAHAPEDQASRLARLAEWEALAEETAAERQCVSLRDLAVNGKDLMELGFAPGPALGKALASLLEGVVEGRLANEKAALLAKAAELEKEDRKK
jgi:tRNA nucleotidyltransferase (CCA-adding enzyme)